MSTANEIRGVIAKWAARGYIVPEAATDIADDLLGVNFAAHLDPQRTAETLDWCMREGGLNLYGWADLIGRLQDCIVPTPPDAPSKVSEAYRRGYADAKRESDEGRDIERRALSNALDRLGRVIELAQQKRHLVDGSWMLRATDVEDTAKGDQ